MSAPLRSSTPARVDSQISSTHAELNCRPIRLAVNIHFLPTLSASVPSGTASSMPGTASNMSCQPKIMAIFCCTSSTLHNFSGIVPSLPIAEASCSR